MYERTPIEIIPGGMYEGGFANSSNAIKVALEHFGVTPPSTLYYPGSSTDISLVGIEGLRVIHADNSLDEHMIGGFALLGAEIHAVDVHVWKPDEPVDVIAFINPSEIDVPTVIKRVNLRSDGLILWAFWGGPPTRLLNSEELDLVAVLNYDEETDKYVINVDSLDEYKTGEKYGSFYAFNQKEK
jgi:hypothetical protein